MSVVVAQGGKTYPEKELRQILLSCLVWVSNRTDNNISRRVAELVPQISPCYIHELAKEVRNVFKLRYPAFLVIREMARHEYHRHLVPSAMACCIHNPGDLLEMFSMCRTAEMPRNMTRKIRIGLAQAMLRFSPYDYVKYNKDGDGVKFRDILNVCKPRPLTVLQDKLFRLIVEDKLPKADQVKEMVGIDEKVGEMAADRSKSLP